MMIVAMLMRPWIFLARQHGVTPRCLADDMLFHATGAGCEQQVHAFMDVSMRYLGALGARVAPRKCFFFANPYASKAILDRPVPDGTIFIVKTDFRDLGAHVNLTAKRNGATLSQRLRKATCAARRLRHVPVGIAFVAQSCAGQRSAHGPLWCGGHRR